MGLLDGRVGIVTGAASGIGAASAQLAAREGARVVLADVQPVTELSPGVPVKDTIKEAEKGLVRETLKRDDLWAVQTPQMFLYEKILNAYRRAMEKRQYATDDAALLERCGGRIRIIMGSYRNIKITTPEDLIIAEALLRI